MPFAAGNFLYIGSSDLVPEVNKHREFWTNVILFVLRDAGVELRVTDRDTLGDVVAPT